MAHLNNPHFRGVLAATMPSLPPQHTTPRLASLPLPLPQTLPHSKPLAALRPTHLPPVAP